MPNLTIVANIKANTGKADLVKTEIEKLIPITRAEPGCFQYDLHQDNDNPSQFMLIELRQNRDLWQQHMNAPHLAGYMAATEAAVAEFGLNEMTQIG